jgi:hypothetical protein
MADRKELMGIAQVMLERLNKQRLPWLLELKAQVEAGGLLKNDDLEKLERVLEEARRNEHEVQLVLDEFPQLKDLVARVIHLYSSITGKALENEGNSAAGKS